MRIINTFNAIIFEDGVELMSKGLLFLSLFAQTPKQQYAKRKIDVSQILWNI